MSPLLQGGYLNDSTFIAGRDDVVLTSLGLDEVYATLVPESATEFQFALDGLDGNQRLAQFSLSNNEVTYITETLSIDLSAADVDGDDIYFTATSDQPEVDVVVDRSAVKITRQPGYQGVPTVSVTVFDAEDRYEQAVLLDKPIAYFRFDELTGAVARDSSGNANDATIQDATTIEFGADGALEFDDNSSFEFDGQGSVALDLQSINQTTGESNTVSFWMNWDGNQNVMPFGFQSYDLYFSGGVFGFNTGNGNIYGINSQPLLNRWVHVVAEFNNGDTTQNRIFLDGTEQTLSLLVGSVAGSRSGSTAANISGWANNGNYRFTGHLDEVAIFNYALPTERVKAQYLAGTTSGQRGRFATDRFSVAIGKGTFNGSVVNDINFDQSSASEPKVEGWNVYADLNNDGNFQPNEPVTVTDSLGEFVLSEVAAGTYHLVEAARPGWVHSFPDDGYRFQLN